MYPIEQQAMAPQIITKIDEAGIIAVLIIDDLKHAVQVSRALLAGGIDTVELTLRTPVALEAAKLIKKEVPEICLGFGTVLTKDQVKAVVDTGADFAVSPGCNPKVIAEARKQGLSFAPGIMTPTDIEMALDEGCRVLKYFPAESSGGMVHLSNMVAPYQYLNPTFIPLGGCNLENAASYLKSSLITAIGGSWVAKRPLIQSENWAEITKNATEITNLIKSIKSTK
jgi:2-dehydro-3-deoxyphosphogluconate aldolase/(4S)-4-hydroxy-2-oxoglutarate aldolase